MSSITSTPFVRRKKQAVYGRSGSKQNNTGNVAFFDKDDDETPWEPATRGLRNQPTIAPKPRNTAASPPRATQPDLPAKKRGALSKVTQSKPREKDPYDVPSDDDETTEIFSNIPVPPKQLIKNRLLDEPKEEVAQLAPWEKKATTKRPRHPNTQYQPHRPMHPDISEYPQLRPDQLQPKPNGGRAHLKTAAQPRRKVGAQA